jgi:hypothetical protein
LFAARALERALTPFSRTYFDPFSADHTSFRRP